MKPEEAISLLQRGLVGEIYDEKGYLTSTGYEALDAIDSGNCPTLVQKRCGEWIDEGFYADYVGKHVYRCTYCDEHIVEYPTELGSYCKYCGSDNRNFGSDNRKEGDINGKHLSELRGKDGNE